MATHKPTYTVSAIETYLRCEKEYELKYVHGIEAAPFKTPGPPGPRRVAEGGGPPPRAEVLSTAGEDEDRPRQTVIERGFERGLSPQQRGILVHEVFQFLEFPGLTNRQTVIEQALINQHLADPEGKLAEEIDHLIVRLAERQDIMELLGSSTNVSTETPFLLDCGSFYLRGKLDRLFQIDNTWMVLDYKTDRIGNPDDLAGRERAYEGQMACYALAVSQILGTSRLKTALLFTDGFYLRTREWDEPLLNEVTKNLNRIHTELTTKTLNDFQYPSSRTICLHCPYFESNYCGVKNLASSPKIY